MVFQLAWLAVAKQDAPATDAAQTKDSTALHTVTMASTGSDADFMAFYCRLYLKPKQPVFKLDVKNFTDYVSMNTAVANKEIDVNAFQSYAYMVAV